MGREGREGQVRSAPAAPAAPEAPDGRDGREGLQSRPRLVGQTTHGQIACRQVDGPLRWGSQCGTHGMAGHGMGMGTAVAVAASRAFSINSCRWDSTVQYSPSRARSRLASHGRQARWPPALEQRAASTTHRAPRTTPHAPSSGSAARCGAVRCAANLTSHRGMRKAATDRPTVPLLLADHAKDAFSVEAAEASPVQWWHGPRRAASPPPPPRAPCDWVPTQPRWETAAVAPILLVVRTGRYGRCGQEGRSGQAGCGQGDSMDGVSWGTVCRVYRYGQSIQDVKYSMSVWTVDQYGQSIQCVQYISVDSISVWTVDTICTIHTVYRHTVDNTCTVCVPYTVSTRPDLPK